MIGFLFFQAALWQGTLTASVSLYVGRNLTTDGSVFLAGYGDEPSSHWIEVVPEQTHPPGTLLEVGAGPEATYPGVRGEIPQAGQTARYIVARYSWFRGFPSPLENGGLNEHGVAARDVACTARQEQAERMAAALSRAGEADLASELLTFYSNTAALEALRLTNALSESIQARLNYAYAGQRPTTVLEGASVTCRSQEP